jgi:RNA-directed DNA polymerase
LQSVLKQADKPAHRAWARVRKQLQIVRYADDFVVMHKNLSVIKEAKKGIAAWLGDMGLQLQPEKTRIVHTLHKFEGNEPGFDFLGFHCRQYSKTKGEGFKTLIKPGKNSIRRHLMSMKESISKLGTDSQNEIITLNSTIMGWSNYYRTCVAKAVFSGVDNVVYWQLSEWVKRSSRGRSLKKKMRKYYKVVGSRKWVFTTLTMSH